MVWLIVRKNHSVGKVGEMGERTHEQMRNSQDHRKVMLWGVHLWISRRRAEKDVGVREGEKGGGGCRNIPPSRGAVARPVYCGHHMVLAIGYKPPSLVQYGR